MKLHELKPAPGSRKARRRVGRGIGSGLGKTSGQRPQRTGSPCRRRQRPRISKAGRRRSTCGCPGEGFNNKAFAVRYAVVNVGRLAQFEKGETVTPERLVEAGIVERP